MLQFPRDFFWGASTSSYQVEGNNVASDWWHWEQRFGKDPSGYACRHYEMYRADFDLAQSLNHNAHRISIEWSRVEPVEGEFSYQEIQHYIHVIQSLRQRGLEPVVTLHHFTNPLWFANKGGWEQPDAAIYFSRYCQRIIDALGVYVHYWVTINEPMVYLYQSYLIGNWPPQAKSFVKAKRVFDSLVRAHIEAFTLIKRAYLKRQLPDPMISIAQNIRSFVPCTPSFRNTFAVALRDWAFNYYFINAVGRAKTLDYIGVNYYTRDLVDVKHFGFASLWYDVCQEGHHPLEKNSLGWDIYPQGLCDLLISLKRYKLPVFILENGICTDDDEQRWNYIRDHLQAVHRAMEAGCPVIGYLYWSLLDNFEWDKGFRPRFGLIDVDYTTCARSVRPSARRFAEVCKTGKL